MTTQLGTARHARVVAGAAFAGASAITFGLNIPAVRAAALLGVDPISQIALRGLLMAIGGALLALALRHSLAVSRDARGPLLVLIASGIATGFSYLSSLALLPVPIAAVVMYTYPLIVMVAAPFVDGSPMPLRRYGVFALAFAGLILAIGPAAAEVNPVGLALAGFGALSCAVIFLSLPRQKAPALTIFVWTQAANGIAGSLVCFVAIGFPTIATLQSATWPLLVTMLGFVLGFSMQLMGARRISAPTAGLMFLLEPIASIAAAAYFLDERLSGTQILGAALVIAALATDIFAQMAETARRRRSEIAPTPA